MCSDYFARMRFPPIALPPLLLRCAGPDGATCARNQARVLAWDIYRHWNLWVRLCSAAEEERLRRRDRTFEDPEEFRHPDELPSLTSMLTLEDRSTMVEGSPDMPQQSKQNPAPVGEMEVLASDEAQAPVTEEGGNGDSLLLSRNTMVEGSPDMPQQSEKKPAPVGEMGVLASDEAQAPVAEGGRHDDSLLRSTKDAQSKSKIDLVCVNDPRQQIDTSLSCYASVEDKGPPRNQSPEEKEKEDYFKPIKGLTARALVCERRQWALRRVRRYEGPNEANQYELGGGSPPSVKEAWPDASSARVNITCGGKSVVGLLVSLFRYFSVMSK